MEKYRLVDTKDKDLMDLNRYMEKIENPPSSPPTISIGKSLMMDTAILAFAGALAISNLGDLIKSNHVRFKNSIFSEESLKNYNHTVGEPFNSYIKAISELTSHKVNMTRDEVVDSIIAFRSLNQSWDGYGALPLEVKSASNAVHFINLLNDRTVETLSDVYPTPNGTVSLVWENDANERLGLEIGNNTLSYYVKLNSQTPAFFNNIEINAKEVNTISASIKAL